MDRLLLNKEYKLRLQDLMSPIEIAEDFTLGDLCLMLARFDKIDLEDLSELLQCHISAFLLECLDGGEATSDLHYLRLTWMYSYETGEDAWGSMRLEVDAVGEVWDDYQPGGQFYEEGKDYSQCNHWGVSFSPLFEMRDLPIRIADTMYWYEELEYPMTERNFCPAPRVTLLDLIYSLFWEFSFYGGPEERDELCNNLKDQVRQIKEEHNVE